MPFSTTVLLLGIYPLYMLMHNNSYCSIVYNSKWLETPKCLATGDWLKFISI